MAPVEHGGDMGGGGGNRKGKGKMADHKMDTTSSSDESVPINDADREDKKRKVSQEDALNAPPHPHTTKTSTDSITLPDKEEIKRLKKSESSDEAMAEGDKEETPDEVNTTDLEEDDGKKKKNKEMAEEDDMEMSDVSITQEDDGK